MMAAQCSDSLARPPVAAAGKMAVAVQDTGDHIIAANAGQDCDRFNQLAQSLSARLTAPAAWQAQFGMHAAFPMKREDQLACGAIDIHQDLLDERADNALL